jgi:ribonuclease VapC
MIAVDTSALMAVLLGEAAADRCIDILETSEETIMSAGTLAEALIVAGARGVGEALNRLVVDLGIVVIPVTPASAQRTAEAYARWGKGNHAAALNFGDCFAYEVAHHHGCPLLFVGQDFGRTDVTVAAV